MAGLNRTKLTDKDQNLGKVFICYHCNKRFLTKYQLFKHIRRCQVSSDERSSRKDQKKYVCKECQKVFSRNCYLKSHVNRIHQNKPPLVFTCYRCKRNLHSKVTLLKHIQKCSTNNSQIIKLGLEDLVKRDKSEKRDKSVSTASKIKKKHICCDCHKVFTRNSYMEAHIKYVHLNQAPPKFACNRCKKNFSRKFTLLRHLPQCVMKDPNETNNQNNLKCAMCDFKNNRTELTEHYKIQHDIDISMESLKFNNFPEFLKWKNSIEKETVAKFVRRNFCKSAKATTYYYRCHRDGIFKTESKNKRHIKMLGSNKINGFCPSKMDVTFTKDCKEVNVKFLKSHVGHQMELRRIPLSKSDRDNVASKLAQKISLDEVLNTIRDDMSENNIERLHLVTKSDLFNIRRMYKLNDSKKTTHDSINIEAWITETHEVQNDPLVRFYKAKGDRNDRFHELDVDDFLLVLMNDAQLDMIKKYGNGFVCVDNTHGSKKCDFILTTVMVLDELQQGFPCLFVFSNRSNYTIFKVAFSVLKEYLGASLQPSVFMSNMAEYFYNAWSEVMGPVYFRLFCTWHIVKLWKENISTKIKNSAKQDAMHKTLRSLLEEVDVFTFEKMLENTLCSMECDQDLVNFRTYFVQTFISNRNFWAYCYRKNAGFIATVNAGVDTNVHLQGMHQTLRHIYLRGKSIKQIVKTVRSLMNLVKQKIHEKVSGSHKEKLSIKSADIRKRHKAMLSLKNCTIMPDNPGKSWLVRSSAGKDLYKIETSHPECSCDVKCADCDTCIHAYVCSCPDSSVKWNMCKHVHLLVQQLGSQCVQETASNSSSDYNIEDLCFFSDSKEVKQVQQATPMLHQPQPHHLPPPLNPPHPVQPQPPQPQPPQPQPPQPQQPHQPLQQSLPPEQSLPPQELLPPQPHPIEQVYYNIGQENAANNQALINFKAKIEQNFLEIMRNVTTIEQCRILDNTVSSLKPTIQPPTEVTGSGFTFFHL